MKDEAHEISMLLDFYGELLTDKQRECVEMYYEEDMSLAEISEQMGITRQGVLDFRVRAVAKLKELEEKIGLIERFSNQRRTIESMQIQLEELFRLTEGRANEITLSLRKNLDKISI